MLERMEKLVRAEHMLSPDSRVLCAVSGGGDSVCLLAALCRLRERLGFTLFAAHYNHTLRGAESDRDEQFVRELVNDRFLGVELYVGSGDVAAEAKRLGAGLEETARTLRYAFLRETARRLGADKIATAHTADDNAETILLHLCRGTGLQGLTGIAPVRNDLIRPLLTTTRQEVEEYLKETGLPHIEDSTNSDDYYARNRVRHQVTPVLEGLYPGFARRLTENAARLRRDEAYLSEQAGKLAALAEDSASGLTISAAVLAQSPVPVGTRAVRRLLAQLREGDDTCSAAHLESVLALCESAAPSGEIHLPGGLLARREYGMLKLTRIVPGRTWNVEITPCIYQGERQSGLELWLSREKTEGLSVRSRREGDVLKLPGRPSKSLKKWLIELKIPRRDRESLPVLTVGGQAAAAACIGPDIRFIPAPGELSWHIVFSAPDEHSDG